MKQFKHLLTAVLSFFICLTVIFPQTISGEENDIKTPLDYALYSESDSISIFSSITSVTGNIYSGKDFTFWGAQYIQNGNIEVKENYTSSDSTMFHTKADEINTDWDKNFDQGFFAKAEPYITYEETKTFNEEPIDISESIYGKKDLIFKGTKFTGKGYIIADGIDVLLESPHFPGQYTIYPTRKMTVDEFNELIQLCLGFMEVKKRNESF